MSKTVQIEVRDDGTIMVGEPAEEAGETGQPLQAQAANLMGGEESAETNGMRPAKSIDEALAIARQMLQGESESEDTQMATGFGRPQAPSMMGRA